MNKGLIGSQGVTPTEQTKKLTLNGRTTIYYVSKIDLSLLYYNDKNDRIATWINKYVSENGPLDVNNREEYNRIIQGFIEASNPDALEKTCNNIELVGQREPGVVLNDGRVIDGNRRYTCLRKLATKNKEFNTFEAVILEGDLDPNSKTIKTLELNLQLGTEAPVDYDPVDRMYSAYRDIVLNRTFTIEEYATEAMMKKKDVQLLLDKAELMDEYLEFIGQKGQYYLAREMKLDGPIQEAVGVLKKCRSEDERERMKTSIFAAIYKSPDGDMTRCIRSFGKIAGTSESEGFYDKMEDLAVDVQTKTEQMKAQTEEVEEPDGTFVVKSVFTPSNIIKEIRKDDSVKKEMMEAIRDSTSNAEIESGRDTPYEHLNRAMKEVKRIDTQMLSKMSDEAKEGFAQTLETLDELIDEFRENL